ncbi:MAG: MBL fold metallo-hydrolase, partial [Clostridiales bacterium]|nr:MBL fold metallo-hydrolase [Clostridiales bacterium]
IIIDNGEAVVVDPADNAEYILEFIRQKGAVLKYVLLTHGHFDHVSAASELQKNGAKIIMSEIDYELIESGELNAMFNVSIDRFNLDITVKHEEVLELIGHNFKVLYTPGHTQGSVCYIMDDDIIFSGDTLFHLSIGRTNFTFGNKAQLFDTVKMLYNLPHDYKVLSGHGPSTTLDFERKNNPYVRL